MKSKLQDLDEGQPRINVKFQPTILRYGWTLRSLKLGHMLESYKFGMQFHGTFIEGKVHANYACSVKTVRSRSDSLLE